MLLAVLLFKCIKQKEKSDTDHANLSVALNKDHRIGIKRQNKNDFRAWFGEWLNKQSW